MSTFLANLQATLKLRDPEGYAELLDVHGGEDVSLYETEDAVRSALVDDIRAVADTCLHVAHLLEQRHGPEALQDHDTLARWLVELIADGSGRTIEEVVAPLLAEERAARKDLN